MKFWQKLFGRRKRRQEEEDWEKVVYTRDGVNFENAEERNQYVDGCLEQMTVAAKEIELLSGEYALVTAYLTDTEEVEALPESEKDVLDTAANRLKIVEQERQDYLDKKDRMPDSVYYRMHDKEEELETGIRKIKEAEQFGGVIKQDMQRLAAERHAYAYRREELINMMENLKGMLMIFLSALVVCIGILAVLQFAFEMDTGIGYFIAVISAAIALTVIWLKHMDAGKELVRVEKATNKLIQLQNKVKIKYVNNTNLLNYLYLKYQVDSGKNLEKQYNLYLQEKEERKQYAEAEAKREYYIKMLCEQLTRYRVRYPERFTARVDALLNRKELVEMRHELIIRRQALRKQIDYNKDIIKSAKEEIMDVAYAYPEFTAEITEKVTGCEKKYQVLQG
ncbi:MAG: hypothetical protein IJX63_09590 [Lachnospiraceae bacterium]|nr:hypothetical protein [Lachnospiraceae bacterium]